MKTKKYLVSTLLASSLVLGFAAASPARAQYKSLQPSTNWTVSKVDKAAQGRSYCTLSRKYEDGIVLSLAHNQAEEYSLAIDFQRDTFEKDKPLKIQLEPGPGQLRAYDLMPVSTKAVVIRLGWDDGFFDTLAQSQQMKVRIGDNAYNFAMPQITKGQGDLTDCTKALQPAAPDKPVTASGSKDVLNADPIQMAQGFEAGRLDAPAAINAAAPAAAKQEQNIAANVTAQEKTAPKPARTVNFNKADAQKTETVPAVRIAAAPAKASETPRAPDENTRSNDNVQLTQLQQSVERLQSENAKLERALDSAQNQASALAAQEKSASQMKTKEADYLEKIAELETANQGLVKQLEIASRVNAQRSSAEEVIDARTKAQMEADAKRIAELEKQAKDLQERLAAATQQATVQTTKAVSAATQDSATKEAQAAQQIAALQAQTKDLQQKLDAALKADAAEGSKEAALVAQMKTQQAESAQKIAALESQNKTLQQQLQSAAKETASSAADAAKIAALDERVKVLQAKNEQLEESLRKSQTRIAEAAFNAEGKALKEIADLEVRLDAAQKDNVNLSRQLDNLRKQKEDGRLSLVAGNWDLEQATRRYNEAEREIRRLGLELEQARTSCNMEKAEIEQMLFDPAVAEREQIEKLMTLEAELRAAKEQLAGRGQPAVSAQMEAQNRALEQEAQGLREQVMALQVQVRNQGAAPSGGNVAVLNQQINTLRDENILLRTEAEKLRTQLTDISAHGASRADNVASTRLQMEDLRRQLALKDAQSRTYQNQLAALQQENSQVRPRPASSQNSGKTAASSITAIEPAAGRGPSYHNSSVRPSASAPESSVKKAAASYDMAGIEQLVRKAGLPVNGLKKGKGMPGAENFNWSNAGGLKGTASVKDIGGTGFDALVEQYVSAQKAQCSGDFASIPSPTASGSHKMAQYETACVSGAGTSSSSIVFFEDQGRFVAIASQGSADDMDAAMDARDKVASAVRGL